MGSQRASDIGGCMGSTYLTCISDARPLMKGFMARVKAAPIFPVPALPPQIQSLVYCLPVSSNHPLY